MYQQFGVTLDGLQYMQISAHTSSSHKAFCTTLGIFGQYAEKIVSDKGAKGGDSDQESESHLLTRYLNSASRTQAIVCIEDNRCESIQLEVLYQLSDGKINVIDIAAGHGAGTLSLINTICDMRREGVLKTSALDIVIHAIDYSAKSLDYYKDILACLQNSYLQHGITVQFNAHVVDITSDAAVSELVLNIKNSIGQNPRYLLICSAISGVTEKVFRERFSISYETLSKSFKENNSSFLWVEPRTKKAWMQKYWQEYFERIGLDPDAEIEATPHMVQQEYSWIDPHNNVKIAPSYADYLLVKLA